MSDPTSHSSRQRYRRFRKARLWKADPRDPAGGAPDAAPAKLDAGRDEDDWQPRKSYLPRYMQIVRPFLRSVVVLLVIGFVAAALDMVFPLALGLIVDHILLEEEMSHASKLKWLGLFGAGVVLVVVASRALDTYRNVSTIKLNYKMVVRLRRWLHAHLLKLPLRDIHEMKSGQIVSRLSGDVDKSMALLQSAIMSPAAASWRVLIATAILFAWNWKLALAAWAVLPPMVVISLIWVKRIRPIFRSAGRDRNLIDARATETFGGIRVVRTFRREPRERRDYTVADDTMIRKRIFGRGMGLVVDSSWQLLIPLSQVAVVIVGGFLYLSDHAPGSTVPEDARTTIGQILAFQGYSARLLFPIFGIVSSLNQTQEALAAMERVFDLFDLKQDKPDPPDAVEAPASIHAIDFERVEFAYTPGVPVIHDFNLHVEGGSVVALVGPSGAGKTTITDLLGRFYDPTGGAIRLNGVDLRKIKLDSYRKLLAVVPQEVFLFDGSVRDNIAYGRRGASPAEVAEAAERANARRFIEQLPEGFETIIGERGVKLSGGQRQRIAIARAILADPQVLILDEATSNLDTESEQLIQAALEDLYENRTTFVIAHRLSTITHADQIVVIDQGRIIEVGDHEELMAREGFYFDMINRQRAFAETA